MKAHLRSAPLAPKKANIIAKMVRGMSVPEAITALERTHKKGARMVEKLLKSAVANAEHNDKQRGDNLVIKSIIVNQALGYRRGIPKARGQMRPMTKFLSHISLSLGLAEGDVKEKKAPKKAESSTKKTASSSQKSETPVQKSAPTVKKAESDAAPEAKTDTSSTTDSSS